jgi:hypothetical protein
VVSQELLVLLAVQTVLPMLFFCLLLFPYSKDIFLLLKEILIFPMVQKKSYANKIPSWEVGNSTGLKLLKLASNIAHENC